MVYNSTPLFNTTDLNETINYMPQKQLVHFYMLHFFTKNIANWLMAGDVGLHEVPITRTNNIGPQAVADMELWMLPLRQKWSRFCMNFSPKVIALLSYLKFKAETWGMRHFPPCKYYSLMADKRSFLFPLALMLSKCLTFSQGCCNNICVCVDGNKNERSITIAYPNLHCKLYS